MATMVTRVESGVVMEEPFALVAGATIAQSFPAALAAAMVEVPDGVTVHEGYLYSGGAFSVAPPPTPPTLTPLQQAQAALGAGCEVTSTGTPALNGTYDISAGSQQKMMAVSLYAIVNGKFPGGTAIYSWSDVAGAPHTFPTTSEFQSFATAIADYVAALDLIIATGAGTLPAQPVTIP